MDHDDTTNPQTPEDAVTEGATAQEVPLEAPQQEREPKKRSLIPWVAGVLALLATGLLVYGMTQGAQSPETQEPSDESSTSAPAGPSGGEPGEVGAIADVSGFTCKATDGVWKASWDVTNGEDKPKDYRFTVNITNKENQLLKMTEKKVTVAPGKKESVKGLEVYRGKGDEKVNCFTGAYKK